ncbi:uncharacterized protein MELLADRAFT_70143 [Melampsora larici-populina 98AG31]|uniref:Uncharacterized protein n=1 Tax=Melampsora larici-populina (strain 98AG31 / pathotype 3-4-7) TaxID=747676 RepID=F4SDS8_MELLP|nr:uncharacterized protein MELLADRAFT_70143 [Melampsora larici-populina 98AG31]EGF97198.1 hypothetical protein MELLADRAFT_70143 [Melampsora larici-populina 98AG31]
MAGINPEHPYADPYIYASSEDPADPQIRCSACNSRTLADYRGHIKTAAHRNSVQRLLQRQIDDEAMLAAIQNPPVSSMEHPPIDDPEEQDGHQPDYPDPESPERPLTPLSFLRDHNGHALSDSESDSGQSDNLLDFQMLRQALEAMDNLLDQEIEEEDTNALDIDDNVKPVEADVSNGWYPFTNKEVRPKQDQGAVPACLERLASDADLEQLHSVTLPSRQKIEPQDFVAVKGEGLIGQVVSLWKPAGESSSKVILILAKCNKGRIVPFYGMREFIVSEVTFPCDIKLFDPRIDIFVPKNVVSLINMQHNCHDCHCTVTSTLSKKIERRATRISVPTMKHEAHQSYILNSASHYSAELHQKLGDLQVNAISPAQWNQSIATGLAKWKATPRPVRKKRKQSPGADSPT